MARARGVRKQKQIRADLHIHTTHSDGALTPEEVVKEAAAAGLNTISITDHDTLQGVAEAQRFGKRYGVEVISGIELSAHQDAREFHIVGLYVDITNTGLLEKLTVIQRSRRKRIREIAERLADVGVKLTAQEVLEIAGEGSPTRSHVAQALVDSGRANDLNDAFHRYIGDTAPGFVAKRFMTVEQAVAEIRRAGGVSILAHPGLSSSDLYIPLFAQMGLNGLEAFYPACSRLQTRHYLDMGRRLGMLISGGSDFHGRRQPGEALGRVRVPGEYVERIKAVAFLLPGSFQRQE
jgi:predicted metal-dependent phosphoesterase TrpH